MFQLHNLTVLTPRKDKQVFLEMLLFFLKRQLIRWFTISSAGLGEYTEDQVPSQACFPPKLITTPRMRR